MLQFVSCLIALITFFLISFHYNCHWAIINICIQKLIIVKNNKYMYTKISNCKELQMLQL